MRQLCVCLLVLGLFLTGQARVCQYQGGVPFLQAMEGVEGGIAPKEPTLNVLVIRQPDGSAMVLARRPGGKVSRGTLASFDKLAADMADVFKLPQDDNGMSDPYGMARALHVHLQDRCWAFSPPTGCIRGKPTFQPDAAQKQTFSQATDRVLALASSATEPSTEDAWNQAWKSLRAEKS